MKLTAVMMFTVLMNVSAGTFAQKVTLNLQEVTADKVFKEIKKQTGYLFLYNNLELKKLGKVSVYVRNGDMRIALDQCLAPSGYTWHILDRTIVISPKPPVPAATTNTDEVARIPLKGIVVDEEGRPIEGASVTVKGTKLGTITNLKGEFSIVVDDANAELLVSFIGFESRTILVSSLRGRTIVNVRLTSDNKKLDEMMIIGYGTTTKRKSTGSVSSITAEDISKQPVQNPLAALEGRIAGAVMTQANGLPGSRVAMLIRGQNSLSNGTVPLYIIDGVPFNINDQSVPASNDLNAFGVSGANSGISPFSLINPSDIERIDVLKDADATAIYGTRGSNGVVLITTKKGKAGKTKFDLNVYQGAAVVPRFLDMMNLKQYLALRREAITNDGLPISASNAPDLATWDTTKSTNWQKKYLGGTAQTTDAEASVSGGDARTHFMVTGGYHRETTVFSNSQSDQRASFRFNFDHYSLDRKFNITLSTMYAYGVSNLTNTDLSSNVYNLPPDLPLYNADGSLYWSGTFTNPQSYLLQHYHDKKNNLLSNMVLKYTILPGLDLKASLGWNRISLDQNKQSPAAALNPSTSPVNSANFATITQQGYIAEPQIVYNRSISQGKLTALAGATWQETQNNATTITASGYTNAGLLGTPVGASTFSVSATPTLYRYNSFFGRLTYDWQSKYIINGNIRRDGSSRFGANHKFGTFGSIAAAWVFTNEKAIAGALPWLSFGKLRSSYGITGNDQIQDYQFIPTLSSTGTANTYQGATSYYITRIANPNLHWETNKKMEVGLDLGFIKDKILLTANYYRNRSDNQLGYLRLATQSGTNAYMGNMPALLQNDGFEFELTSKNISTHDFTWTTSFNMTIPRNKLLKVDPNYFYATSYKLGKSLNQVWKYLYAGVDPSTGKPMYRNQTKDTLTFSPNYSTDRVVVGDTDPHLYGGLSNTFSWKGFDFSFFFQFMKRNGNIYPSSAPGALSNGNMNVYWLNRWNAAGTGGPLPKATTITSTYSYYGSSTANWGDNSFVKLRNVSLSYTLPAEVVHKIKMNMLRVYVQAQNLYTWTKNKYTLDPETFTTINQASVVMPPLRTITAGINCSF